MSPRKPALPLEPPARNFSARGIAALLAPVLRPVYRKRAPAAYQILADWDALAGPEIAAHARPLKFAGGTLTLACSGPTAMDLQYRGAALISRLNTGLGSAAVERLRFVQEIPELPEKRSKPEGKPVPGLTASLPDGPLGDALAKLYQDMAAGRQ